MMFKSKVLSILVCCILTASALHEEVTVQTPLGDVVGSVRSTSSGTKFHSFQGFPFAQPPVGNLRFLPPAPITEPWTSPLSLQDDFLNACPQKLRGELIGDEDCLYMNIYTPANITSSAPVLIWMYGGGFINGNNMITEYGPQYYLDQGVIVVIPNYRTGILGFFCLNTENVPGNQGLLDQVEAMRVVNMIISSFGGDSERITVAGQSAGSGSVMYHVMSPLSQGLFQRVIAQSGSNFSPSLHSVTADEITRYSEISADLYGCLWPNDQDKLECMQRVEASSLANLNDAILINHKPNEDASTNPTPFMPMSPMEALRTGNYNQNVTVMIGSTKDDGIILTSILVSNPIMYFVYKNFWTSIAPGILFHVPIDATSTADGDKALELADFYLGGLSNMNEDHFTNITQMFTDAFVTYAVECFVSKAKLTQNVYQYLYSYNGQYGLTQDEGLPNLGVDHADELYLQWNHLFGQDRPLNQEDSRMSVVLMEMWTNFIKSGVPGESWDTVADSGMYLNIKSPEEVSMERSDDYDRRMNFWKYLFPC